MLLPPCSEEYKTYFTRIEEELKQLFNIANAAKAKGLDPKTRAEDEISISKDFAERVESMVGPPAVAKRIRELSHMERVPLAFKIAEEIVYGGFGEGIPEKLAEQAIKTGTAILTEGVTVAPIQGIVKVSIKKRQKDHETSRYLAIYFAGPIRSAGGTELGLIVVLGDHVRKILGLDSYKASEEEVLRFIEELRLYEREVSRFQFHVDDETIAYILKHLPVEVTGIKTDPVEVSSFRNIPGIETNCVRGGALRVINDGIAGRASKIWKVVDGLKIKGWEWLKNITVKEAEVEVEEAGYLQDVIAGRPVFSSPSLTHTSGGFRLRYGRARNTGLSCVGVHPATMVVVDGFIAVGTQLRLEFPCKGGVVGAVETIEPPVVRLKDGSVVRVESLEEALEVKDKIEKILFLGDLLISYSEFFENDKSLAPSGYVEEWWILDLKKEIKKKFNDSLEKVSERLNIPPTRLEALIREHLQTKPTVDEALEISLKLDVPLHPKYTYFWRRLTLDEFFTLREILNAHLKSEDIHKTSNSYLKLDYNEKLKNLLEKLIIPHKVENGKIILNEEFKILCYCLGLHEPKNPPSNEKNVLNIVSFLAGFKVRDKYPTFVGARMGRPEKAKERKMKPPVHVLFPIGLSGGPQRNIIEASKNVIEVELISRVCRKCAKETYRPICPNCGEKTDPQLFCPSCGRNIVNKNVCPVCKVEGKFYKKQIVDLKDELENAYKNLGIQHSFEVLKGVKGLTNEKKIPEPLEKGLLRVKHGLTVFKDGTIRYDITNAPLTHFKPSEVGVSVEKFKELGYNKDWKGAPLTSPDQLLELKVQDIIIPEKCANYLVKVANFVDELLERFYNLPRFYNVKKREDIVGHLVIGLSPHTSNGVLGRIAGFSKLNVCYAHPLWIAAKRRDCDGDEDSIMLALDALLNFSREYAPEQIGGIMDTPLLLTPIINPLEVDDQVWSLDLSITYPEEFYYKTFEEESSRRVSKNMEMLMFKLNKPEQYEGYGFTHNISNINCLVNENTYKKLKTMKDKLQKQMLLMDRIEGINSKEAAKKVLEVHFMRDIVGNLKGFASQPFRCKRCNIKYRRVPLKGRCLKCGGELTLTIYKGTVQKYLGVVEWLTQVYGFEDYHKQRIELIMSEIKSIFLKDMLGEEKSKFLTDFM